MGRHSHSQSGVRQLRFRHVLVCQTVAKNQFWKEGVQFILHFKVHHEGKLRREGIQGRNWNKGHGATLLTGLLSMSCSVCILVQPRITYPGMTLLWVGDLDSPTSVVNQELTPRLAHRLSTRSSPPKVWPSDQSPQGTTLLDSTGSGFVMEINLKFVFIYFLKLGF